MALDDDHADAALQRSEEKFRLLIDSVRDHAIFMLDPAGRIVSWNAGAERMTGWSEADILGVPFAVLLNPVETQATQAARLLETARRVGHIEEDGKQRRRDGAIISVIMTLSTLAAHSGSERGFAVVLRDVTESRRSEDRQRALVREVDHRTKNALAVVQSILRLSIAADTPSFIRVVEGRIAALARIHTRIATHRWEAAPLDAIIDDELATLDHALRSRVQVAGPLLWLVPKAAQAIALTVHELATNAWRHGALARMNGNVVVRWSRDESGNTLFLNWIERDGSKSSGGIPESFGLTIVRAMVETQLEGDVQLDWSSGDLACRLSVPSHHIAEL